MAGKRSRRAQAGRRIESWRSFARCTNDSRRKDTASEGYYGCAFVRASIEYPDPKHPVHRAAKEHIETTRSYLRGLAGEVADAHAVTLSEQLYLLLEGAITASQLHGEPWPAEYARQAAQKLMDAASHQAE
jgi:hypothetical protein